MHSAVIPSELSYPALLLAEQLVHQRFVHLGPLVLKTNPFKYPTPTADRDRTVSRRSKPSSRTTLIGEQPNPWDLLQPQDACYPQSTFYPLSDGPSIQNHRITKTYFRTCSSRHSRSQAGLCLCTNRMMSDHA